MRRAGGSIAVLALVLAGCTGGGGDDPEPSNPAATTSQAPKNTPTTTVEASTSPTTDDSGLVEPNVGDRALRIGQARVGSGFVTRLLEYRYPMPPALYREPDPGKQYFGLRIRECMKKSEPASPDAYATYNGEWYIVSPGGGQFTSSSSYSDWPSPKFPEDVTMNPGECLKGWLAVQVPVGTKMKKVVYRPTGTTVAEWLP